MRKRRLLWILYPSYLIVVLLAVLAIGSYTSQAMKRLYLNRAASDLQTRLKLILRELPATYPLTPTDSLARFCHEKSVLASARITLVSPQSRVLADSHEDPREVETITYRSEFEQALKGRTGIERRFSPVTEAEILYVAIPIWEDKGIVGAVRAAVPMHALTPELHVLNVRLLIGGLIVAILAALVTWMISRWIARPITEMEHRAERFASGDFSQKMPVPASVELGGLAIALNNMADQLDEKIRTITVQRNEQEAILTSLREGVIALDNHERVLFVNRAAAVLFGIDVERAIGRLLQEVLRNSELQKFTTRLLAGKPTPAESEVTLVHGDNRILQVTGTSLRDASGQRFGVVVVINDVTRLRRLERVRKDFVANVSHELKTPITSIKGFVETLFEGALDQPAEAKAFLNRIASNTERLNAIIDDLLMLSRVEQDSEQGSMPLTTESLREVIESAIASVESKARDQQITIRFSSPDDIQARVNSTLIGQAVVNLLDNAIKYSDSGRSVDVDVTRERSSVSIRVRDHGVGIAAEHLPRIFERFYRVDKARSRKLGGTGLGLSIVKHIAQAHGGSVAVESTPGHGSTFTIFLPTS